MMGGDDSTLQRLWRSGQRGWPPGFPVAQLPNGPLLAALGGWSVAELADGAVRDYGRAAFYAGLAAWAWLELTDGANWFRRALGAGGLAYVVREVGDALSG